MLNKKLNPKLLWMQFEDVLAPRLGLTVKERAVYSYLLRHSLVVGKLRLDFAVLSVARDAPAREAEVQNPQGWATRPASAPGFLSRARARDR
jgi:hypothetical protein